MELLSTLRRTVSGEDDRAVSPVIGVILMVAITVILAAVIATFVLGLGESVSNVAPQANFDVEAENDTSRAGISYLNITHTGGDPVPLQDMAVSVGGTQIFSDNASASGDWNVTQPVQAEEMRAGNLLAQEENGATGGTVSGETDIRILFLPDEGSTATLAERTVDFPD